MKMKLLKFITFLLVLAGSNFSCTEEKGQEKISFIQIGQGNLYGNGEEGISKQDVIINTQEKWDILKTTMNLINNVTNSFSEMEINFNVYQIIAVFDKVYYNGYWSICIVNVIDDSDKVVVTVSEKSISSGVNPLVTTQPYQIVKIPITTKRIVFQHINI
jgi:hypothetical protein